MLSQLESRFLKSYCKNDSTEICIYCDLVIPKSRKILPTICTSSLWVLTVELIYFSSLYAVICNMKIRYTKCCFQGHLLHSMAYKYCICDSLSPNVALSYQQVSSWFTDLLIVVATWTVERTQSDSWKERRACCVSSSKTVFLLVIWAHLIKTMEPHVTILWGYIST